jgi:hypothetical protein
MANARSVADAGLVNAAEQPVSSLKTRRLPSTIQQRVKGIEARYTTFIAPHRLQRWKTALPSNFKTTTITFSEGQGIAEEDDVLKVQSFKVLLGLQSAFGQILKSTDPLMQLGDLMEEVLAELDAGDWHLILGSVLSLHIKDLREVRSLCSVKEAQESLRDFMETPQYRVMEFLRVELASEQASAPPVLEANFMAENSDAATSAGADDGNEVDVLDVALEQAMEEDIPPSREVRAGNAGGWLQTLGCGSCII